MRSVLARRERAFERVYRRHVGDVYRYALGVLRNPEDAHAITRTTFQNAHRAYSQGAPRPELNSLLGIAHEVCRRRGGYPRLTEADLHPDEDEMTTADVRRALGRLGFEERTVLVMRELEHRSYREISELLEIPIADVEPLIFRARSKLRDVLAGSITCREAERAISNQLDDRLPWREARSLRRHLDACDDCEAFARGQELQRAALVELGAVPLPESLRKFSPPPAST